MSVANGSDSSNQTPDNRNLCKGQCGGKVTMQRGGGFAVGMHLSQQSLRPPGVRGRCRGRRNRGTNAPAPTNPAVFSLCLRFTRRRHSPQQTRRQRVQTLTRDTKGMRPAATRKYRMACLICCVDSSKKISLARQAFRRITTTQCNVNLAFQ